MQCYRQISKVKFKNEEEKLLQRQENVRVAGNVIVKHNKQRKPRSWCVCHWSCSSLFGFWGWKIDTAHKCSFQILMDCLPSPKGTIAHLNWNTYFYFSHRMVKRKPWVGKCTKTDKSHGIFWMLNTKWRPMILEQAQTDLSNFVPLLSFVLARLSCTACNHMKY